jgi:protoheme IX farnesyltransferase
MEALWHAAHAIRVDVRARVRAYWKLIKSLQTGLLVVTGVAGFMSARCPITTWQMILAVIGSLFLAISGSTLLNMVYDRDIDARMQRTRTRSLPSGEVSAHEALLVGLTLAYLGVFWAASLSPLYGLVVFAGLFFDVLVYTIWLKRRTAWSVVWGGISGGMPILAGRALGMGQIDAVGLLLALAVLLWIPTHILTFGIKYASDYQRAGVPVFANTYGEQTTRRIIGASTVLAAGSITAAAWMLGLQAHCLYATITLGVLLIGLTLLNVVIPSPRLNFAVFKAASLYMLSAMLLMIVGL